MTPRSNIEEENIESIESAADEIEQELDGKTA